MPKLKIKIDGNPYTSGVSPIKTRVPLDATFATGTMSVKFLLQETPFEPLTPIEIADEEGNEQNFLVANDFVTQVIYK